MYKFCLSSAKERFKYIEFKIWTLYREEFIKLCFGKLYQG